MKMIKVMASEDHLKQGEDLNYFRFNEYNELVSTSSEIPAWFDSKETAIETLTEFGFDEVDFASMEFIEFDYVPKISNIGKSESAPPANIYINGVGFTTNGFGIQDFTEETYAINDRDVDYEIIEEGEL